MNYKALLFTTPLIVLTCVFGYQYPYSKFKDFPPRSFNDNVIKTIPLGKGAYEIEGDGGNITLSIENNGIIIVDDGYEAMAPKLIQKIHVISDKPIRYVINTHWHFDHASANKQLHDVGAQIIAQDNARKRLQSGGYLKFFSMSVAPASKESLPDITYTKNMTLYFKNNLISIVHPTSCAHTDGDSIVFFQRENILSMGDIYLENLYPFIDASSGGCLYGLIDAAKYAYNHFVNQSTIIITGHGKIGNKASLSSYIEMLEQITRSIKNYSNQGKTLQQIIQLRPTKKYDSNWSYSLVPPQTFVEMIYNAIKKDNIK